MTSDPAGMSDRDLDAEIAERVMGIVPRNVRIAGSDKTFPVYSANKFYSDGACTEAELRAYRVGPEPYSTTGDGMLRVVEAMRSKGFYFSLQTCHAPKDPFCAIFAHNGAYDERAGDAGADSAPRAVALAALAAVRAEK